MDTPLSIVRPIRDTPAAQAMTAQHTLEQVYRDHFAFVYRKAARLGGPSVDAEDVAQEVFVIVSRKLESFNGSSAITTWLHGITLNVVRHARRRARLRQLFEWGPPADEQVVPAIDRVEVSEAQRIAYRILDRMRPKHRDVFILSELEGATCEEIAGVVNCKVETVWSRLHYARKEFARRLERLMTPGRTP
jgi:RNA polymerase sigma-70 factor (ECF subfamily)